ncbi:MAG TPA: ribosome maturation factor RimM [Acidobacteriaceae bacterium]
MQHSRQWTILARILRPQGRKGEVLADLLTDFPDSFAERPEVHLAPAGFAEEAPDQQSGNALQPAQILSYWLPVGRNAGRVVLHFTGVDSITQAEALAGKEVVVPFAERMPLEDGAVYVADLIGCTVTDRDTVLGVVDSVHFPASPDGARHLDDAAPLLSVKSSSADEILIPFVNSYLVAVDLPGKIIRMDLPEGLAALNAPQSGQQNSDADQ